MSKIGWACRWGGVLNPFGVRRSSVLPSTHGSGAYASGAWGSRPTSAELQRQEDGGGSPLQGGSPLMSAASTAALFPHSSTN